MKVRQISPQKHNLVYLTCIVDDPLSNAVNGVYDGFKAVRRPSKIDGCRCCIEDKQVHVLLSKPLRDLSPDELTSYASSVFLTVGSEADFRYYLPRILEITVTDSGWWPDPEVVGHKLSLAAWSKWSVAERESITRLFEIHFDELVAATDGWSLDSWLCGLARSGTELKPFLDKLSANPAAALAVYQQNANELMDRRLGNAFWEDAPQAALQQIVAWFHSPDISLLILRSYGVDLNVPRSS